MDPHVEKPCGDGYHANGQSDSEVWSETPMDPAEARRSRLSFSDTYVEMLYVPVCGCDDGAGHSLMGFYSSGSCCVCMRSSTLDSFAF